MIPIKTKIERDHRLTRKDWRKVSGEAWEDVGTAWHEELLPKHFERGAFREYRYKPRTKKHEAKKQRLFGHKKPLVFKGDLRRAVLRQRSVTTVGNSSKRQGAVKIKLSGPAYLGGRALGRRGINFARELQAISNRDAKRLARVMDKKLQAELNERGPKKRLTGHRG